MEKTVCVNQAAGCKTEGGRFHLTSQGYVCEHCYKGAQLRDSSKALWPMRLDHITSPIRGPIVAQSLRHLRQIESEYGVQSVAFNNDSKNWDR